MYIAEKSGFIIINQASQLKAIVLELCQWCQRYHIESTNETKPTLVVIGKEKTTYKLE